MRELMQSAFSANDYHLQQNLQISRLLAFLVNAVRHFVAIFTDCFEREI